MTIRFTEGDGIPTDVVGFTEELYLDAIAELREVIAALKAGQFGEAKAVKSTVRNLQEMAKLVIQERSHVEALRKQVAGAVGAGTELDLGAARDEIGRRLALLRDARGD